MNISHKFCKKASRVTLAMSLSGAFILISNAHAMDESPFQCPSAAEVMEYINNLKKYSNYRNLKTEMGFILFSKDARKNWELLDADALFDESTGYTNLYKYPAGFTKARLSQKDDEGKICQYQAQQLGMASNFSEIPFTFREYSNFGNSPIFPETGTDSIDIEIQEPSFALPPMSSPRAIESDEMPGIGVPLYEPYPNTAEEQVMEDQEINPEMFAPKSSPDVVFGQQIGDDAFGSQPDDEYEQSRNMPGFDDNLSFEPPNVTAVDDDEEFGDWHKITEEANPADEPGRWGGWGGWIPFGGR